MKSYWSSLKSPLLCITLEMLIVRLLMFLLRIIRLQESLRILFRENTNNRTKNENENINKIIIK